MIHFKVISVDMFQTLVDVNRLRYYFWEEVLGKHYSEAMADEYTKQWGKLFPDFFNQIVVGRADDFLTLKPIFECFWAMFFEQFKIDFDHRKAAQIHFEVHRLAPAYEDTEKFLATVGKHFPICLVSDSDDEMILPHLEKYNFDRVFISERLETYKSDAENRMFRTVINHYKIPPEEILHIGDMYFDIAGANQAGITSCWLNRDGKSWNYDVKPDFEIASLLEAVEILGIPVE